MFHVPYFRGESRIHGIGLFAAEDIPEGAPVWTKSENLTFQIPPAGFAMLSEQDKFDLRFYGYFSRIHQLWIDTLDDSRLINHAEEDEATLGTAPDESCFAKVDLPRGVELTQFYGDFEDPVRDFDEINTLLPMFRRFGDPRGGAE